MRSVIKVENLCKQYRLGEVGTGTLSHDLNRWWARVRGKEDPFSKIGEINDRTKRGTSDYIWALKDIDFEVKQGQVLGIIGRNGAGKSTLLKILSKVTRPSLGRVKISGRIASLLEVGTGFHPEMTGRENIFLNGAIMGMNRAEIKRKFDSIVDFAGVERYIDTPVKRYSSGMYVRLAFGVAAHLDAEIMIIDEVLAVGDAEFQKKCMGKMGELSKEEGRTVLYVSHNMGSVMQLCESCLLLNEGTIQAMGRPSAVLQKYYERETAVSYNNDRSDADIFLAQIFTCDKKGIPKSNFAHKEEIHVRIKIGINRFAAHQNIAVCLLRQDKKRVFTVNRSLSDLYKEGSSELTADFIIEGGLIAPMDYSFLVALNNRTGRINYDLQEDICPVKVYDDGTDLAFAEGTDYGCIILNDKWNLIE